MDCSITNNFQACSFQKQSTLYKAKDWIALSFYLFMFFNCVEIESPISQGGDNGDVKNQQFPRFKAKITKQKLC